MSQRVGRSVVGSDVTERGDDGVMSWREGWIDIRVMSWREDWRGVGVMSLR